MTNTKVLMRSAAATGISGASAQQTIAPASATPVPGPMPEILRAYAGHRRATQKAGGRQLVDVPPHVRRLGLQSAR